MFYAKRHEVVDNPPGFHSLSTRKSWIRCSYYNFCLHEKGPMQCHILSSSSRNELFDCVWLSNGTLVSNLRSTWIPLHIIIPYRKANSTPMVLLLCKLNSSLVYLDSKLLFPTPESPISTTVKENYQLKGRYL